MFVPLWRRQMIESSRGAMKRIQPFTIGTKLSVPTETKCPDYTGIILPVPAVDCCELRNESNDDISPVRQESTTSHNSASMEEVSEEEDRDSASPSASSRSIRKIAMCGNTERQRNCRVSNAVDYETNNTNTSNEKLERLSDRSASHLETDLWTRGRKMKNLHYEYSTSSFPHDQSEDASHSQRRDLKDFENSLIQLTTSLDLSQEEPNMPHQKKTEVEDLGLEMFSRRPSPGDHIDKSWMKIKSLLRDYHQDLMLALEVSSFYQQADNIISAINCKKNSLFMTDIHKSSQDIACQINMLNESASRLSNIHPTLARRVSLKQAEVKENWAFLQELLRNQKTDVSSKRPSSSAADPLTTCPDSQSFARNDGHSVMGKDVKEEQNRLRGFECSYRMWSPVEECSVESRGSLSEINCSKPDSITGKHDMDRESSLSQMPETSLTPSNKHLVPCEMSNELTTCSRMDVTTVSDGEDPDRSKQSHDHKLEELLSQVEVLWDALQEKYGDDDDDEIKSDDKEPTGDEPDQMMPDFILSNLLPGSSEEGSSGMLAKFLELLDPSGYQKLSPDVPKTHHSTEMIEDAEMSLDLLEGQTDGERFYQTTEDLQISLSTLTLRINQHLSRCAELSMDLLDIETDIVVLCDPDMSGLDGLYEQQDDLQAHYHIIEGEVKEMERLAGDLRSPSSDQRDPLREEIQTILQAWEEVGRNMSENRGRLEKFHQIQEYFENYLAMIAWTENIRSCILAGGSAWRENEVTEIDRSIEMKLDEFTKLTTAGEMLVQEECPFKNIIKERTDELQSMLGWIQVNWRVQREHLKADQNARQEEIPLQILSSDSPCPTNTDNTRELIQTKPFQNRFEQHKKHDVSSVESCLAKTSLGSSICLILSFDEQSSGINQVTKQWSPNDNDDTVATHAKEDVEDSNAMQQCLETLQMRWSNGSIINQEPEQKSSCGISAQQPLNNQEQPVQSPRKEELSSDLFLPGNIQRSSLNHVTESQQSPANNETPSPVLSDSDLMQKPELSVMHQAQNQPSPNCSQKPTSDKNDHLRNEVAAEVTHRVFTYLHVSDSYKSHATAATSPVSSSSTHSSSFSVHNDAPDGETVCDRFKASSAFTLTEPVRCREREQRRPSTLGIVELERSKKSSSTFRRRCNTWPEEKRKEKESQSDPKLQVFVKKSSIMLDSVIEDKANSTPNAIKTPSVKNICSYLSLGSTLNFCLPKRFHSSVTELENKEQVEPAVIINNNLCELNNQSLSSAQTPTDMSTSHHKPVTQSEETEVDSPSVCQETHVEDTEKSTDENETQQLKSVLMQEEVLTTVERSQWTHKDTDKHKPALNIPNKSPCDSSCDHKCLSVHTKIKDLKSHLYYSSKYVKINSPSMFPPQVLSDGLWESGSRKNARIINCGLRDCVVCCSDTGKEIKDASMKKFDGTEWVLQPGHWLFQQDEEELEDIWRGRVDNPTSNCTMETNRDEEPGLSITDSRGQVPLPLHG